MDNLQGQVINSGTDANPDPRTIGKVDRNGNSLVIYDTEGNLIRQYNIDPNNENRSAEPLALLVRPDAQSSDTQTLFVTGRDMGYTGGEINESESGDYVSILETIPMDEDEFIRFLGNEPAFQNSNYKVEKPNSTDNKITIRTKQEEYIGTYKTDDPYQRKMLIKQLNELGLDFPDIKRPAGLTTSAERFPEQDNNTSSVTGGTSR
jgi:hypothetical protein